MDNTQRIRQKLPAPTRNKTLTIEQQVSNRLLQNKAGSALDYQTTHLIQLYRDRKTAQAKLVAVAHAIETAEQIYKKIMEEGYYWQLPICVNTKEEGYYWKIPVNTKGTTP